MALEQSTDLEKGLNLLPFDVGGLPPGLYYCIARGEAGGMAFVKG